MDSPDSAGVKMTFATPSTVVTEAGLMLPSIVIAVIVNSSGRVPSSSAMFP